MQFPRLFKKTATGATQYWEIKTKNNVITTRYGQVGGLEQTTDDIIDEGKNLGKANATTAVEQAEAEAKSKWEKQMTVRYRTLTRKNVVPRFPVAVSIRDYE